MPSRPPTAETSTSARRSWRALVDGKNWEYGGHGQPLEDIEPPHFGDLMASAEKTFSAGETIPDAGVPDENMPDSGTPDGGTPNDATGGCSATRTPTTNPALLALFLATALLARRRKRGQSPFSRG